jgi:hypothetical protein
MFSGYSWAPKHKVVLNTKVKHWFKLLLQEHFTVLLFKLGNFNVAIARLSKIEANKKLYYYVDILCNG